MCKSSGDDGWWFYLVLLVLLFGGPGFLIGMVVGTRDGLHRVRVEAVAKKHAEFVPQPDGSTKFHWIGDESK